MEEQEAIARLKQGDIRGLRALVREHQVQAIRTAYLITRDRAQAEDIVQAAFLRAYERIDQFDAARPFAPWFLRSVANDALKAVTRDKRHISLEGGLSHANEQGEPVLAELLATPDPGPEELVEAAELRQAVWDALGRLPTAFVSVSLAQADPDHYLVLDAREPVPDIAAAIQRRVEGLLR